MRNKIFLSMAVTSLVLAGCGTIVNGGNQTVDVVVKGSPSAFCTLTTSTFKNAGTFPNTVTLERSKETLIAECRGEQNLYKKFEIAPIGQGGEAVAGNVLNGTTILGGAYDSLSGGAWAYPNPIIVDFRVVEGAPPKIWPDEVAQSKIVAPEPEPSTISKPNPLRMQPIFDEEVNPATKKQATALPKSIAANPQTSKMLMSPVVSPEDDPAYLKAKAEAEAKAKAKAAAKKKAAAEAAAKKKAAAAAKAKAAAEAEAKAVAPAAAPVVAPAVAPAVITPAETLPQVEDVAPSEPAPAVAPTPTPDAAPKADAAPQSTDDIDKYLTGTAQ